MKFTTRDGSVFTLRQPRLGDEKRCQKYINGLVDEGAKIIIDERVTLKQERIWLKENIEKIRKGQLVSLVAEKDGEIAAICHIAKRGYKMSHIADLGIGVSKRYRRIGLAQAIFSETRGEPGGRASRLSSWAPTGTTPRP